MKSLWPVAIVLGAALAGTPAAAENDLNLSIPGYVPGMAPRVVPQVGGKKAQSPVAELCANPVAPSQAKRAAACSKLIGSHRWKGKDIAWAYANRCIAYELQGERDKALADCAKAVTLDPQNAAAYQIRGKIFQSQGESDKALADYNKAIQYGAKNAAIFSDRGTLLLAKGEADKALADYNKAIAADAQKPSAYLDRGSAWLAMGEADKAVADFGKAAAMDPKNDLALFDRGAAYLAAGDSDKAASDFRQSLKMNPANAYAGLWLFMARGGGAAAKKELQTYAAHFSKSAWPWPVMQSYLGEGSGRQALAAARSAGERCEAQFYIGEERVTQNANDEALPYLRKAVAICPKNYAEYFRAVAELKKLDPTAALRK